MARESFEAEDVAALLNAHFICVKVDREERPDIDQVYMKVCQTLTGRGGWPLTIIMTPDKIPFFAGTYFPRESRYNLPGIKDVLGSIAGIWQEKRDTLEEKGRELIAVLQQWEDAAVAGGGNNAGGLNEALLKQAAMDLRRGYDQQYGGLGGAPKFPMPHTLTFLLRAWKRSGSGEFLQMAVHTLTEMRQGGIFDQLGYGFHRYSVDAKWRVPHFEKMLYDQALLAIAYLEGYQATGEPLFADTVHAIFTYVLGEMQDRGGAFYAAENAESEGVEGKYYTWRQDELMAVLGAEEGGLICEYFGVTAAGDLEDGQNVLHLPVMEKIFREKHSLAEKDWFYRLEEARRALLQARSRRVRPSRDEKILTSWNGLMISALAKGGGVLQGEFYLEQARRAADFILTNMLLDGELYHRCMEGEAAIPAFLEDYAFFCAGLLDLFEATQEYYYLEQAVRLNQQMINLFWDAKQGGFFFVRSGSAELPLTGKDIHDGATPSGNAVAVQNLLRLAAITGGTEMEEKAALLFAAFTGPVKQSPSAFTALLSAYDFACGPLRQIIVAGPAADPAGRKMLQKVRELFLPHRIILYVEEGDSRAGELCPQLEGKTALEGKATAYVCQNFSCQAPVQSVAALLEQLT